ncbi:MAG: hydantoinase/oxoprolinase N-terminal domain-containing protein, partial [Acidimicrobiales bacterium]
MRVGIDVGGTFTDLILSRADGSFRLEKSPTTPGDQSEGVLSGLDLLAEAEGRTLGDLLSRVATIVHGTTTGDNTLIQMN